MKRRAALLLAAVLLGGCGSPAPESAGKKAAAPKKAAKVSDERRRFPAENQVKMEVVPERLLGKDFLPGGNQAEYRRGNKTYQLFLVRAADANRAAILLFDLKNALKDPKVEPHFGGFFGLDGATPIFCFQKGEFLAGVAGLPEAEADAVARVFAARL